MKSLKRNKRPSNETIKTLKSVGLGLFAVSVGASPTSTMNRVLRECFKEDSPSNRQWLKRRIYEMRRKRYIEKSEHGYALSDIGRSILREDEIWSLTIPKLKRWDRVWRIVAFDIPHEKARVRIPFIRQLQNLGLIFYQRSIWIYPYPFEKEVSKIANFYGVFPYISFITATNVDGAAELQRRFKLVV